MSTAPIESLHLKAVEQRADIHRTVSELRQKASTVRDRLKFSKQAREHLLAGSVITALLGFAVGYGIAGLFTSE
jgi:hypothetical protein